MLKSAGVAVGGGVIHAQTGKNGLEGAVPFKGGERYLPARIRQQDAVFTVKGYAAVLFKLMQSVGNSGLGDRQRLCQVDISDLAFFLREIRNGLQLVFLCFSVHLIFFLPRYFISIHIPAAAAETMGNTASFISCERRLKPNFR